MPKKKVERVMRDALTQAEEACVLNLDIRCWGAKSSVDVEKYGMDKKLFDAFQSILEDRGEIEEMDNLRNEIKNWVGRPVNSIRHPIPGLRVVFKRRVARIDEKLHEFHGRYWRLVERMIESLPEHQRYYQRKHPEYYDASKYPTPHQVRAAHRFNWRFMNFAPMTADGNHDLPPSFYREQERKAREEWRRVTDEGIKVVGGLFLNKVDSLRKQCFDGQIHSRTVDTFVEYLENFDESYGKFLGHSQLNAAVKKAKDYLLGTDADMLRADEGFRNVVGQKMEEILKGINKANDVRLHRHIDI
jgi:hypothetical protein